MHHVDIGVYQNHNSFAYQGGNKERMVDHAITKDSPAPTD